MTKIITWKIKIPFTGYNLQGYTHVNEIIDYSPTDESTDPNQYWVDKYGSNAKEAHDEWSRKDDEWWMRTQGYIPGK